ncbi:ribosome biogenesis protein WDR12 homolog isoform X4 [Hevea brasiliensis]|uniref:ribosome biogenesis protein WDR12 homolog isoform X4 n=1 Tax=Hevea brasiliensis TaxID=3981 RepID=UPI0025FA5F73|nr:ribosome biogenesis protein WDR12 homolog isoform X4 [Hevea brasiliensis]
MEGDAEERQIQARFVTKLKTPYKVPATAITIPANLTRLGLSTIVSSLLNAGNPDWENQPFDFLIDGELVRMSLEQFLLAKGISAEKIIEIEYIKAVVPRKQEEPSLHDDWVSAADGSCPRFILTGCYDGLGRVWKAAGLCTHMLEGHSDAITSVSIIFSGAEDSFTVATASKDQTLRLWKFDTEEPENSPANIRAFKILRGHNASVQSVAAETSGSMGEAMSTLVGHTQRVSSVVWPEHETIYSASWDHSIRRWDVETGKDSAKIFCGKALNYLHVGGEGSALIAAGASDPILRIWDPRKPGTSAPIYQFCSHTSWVSACKWHDKSWFHLLSASYDGKVMLWDLRTAWPLAVIESHEDKVLCVDWWRGDNLVSGGVDCKLCISSDSSVQ